jgi:hypothetical protein
MYKKERPKLSVTALLYGTQSPNTWIQQHSGMHESLYRFINYFQNFKNQRHSLVFNYDIILANI